MSGDLENIILGVVDRWWASRYSERHGLVTSYDPKKYLAKVTFQPEGQESGWLPIETGHVGQGYGITIGLQPGSGNSGDTGNPGNAENASQAATGDQVVVRYQEGDFESGKIVQRVHSNNDTPPPCQSGEMLFWSKFQNSGGGADSAQQAQGGTGQQFYFKNDGSLTSTDGNGATIALDGNGNIVITCKKFTVNASDDLKLISTTNALLKGASAIVYATANVFLKAISTINAKSVLNKADPDWVNGASEPPISG